VITSRWIQAYVGWNPKIDVAFQRALRERTRAQSEIAELRKLAPDLVSAEEQRRAWTSRIAMGWGKLWKAIPWAPWGPFGRPLAQSQSQPPKVIRS
jgi:hypothetical protein